MTARVAILYLTLGASAPSLHIHFISWLLFIVLMIRISGSI